MQHPEKNPTQNQNIPKLLARPFLYSYTSIKQYTVPVFCICDTFWGASSIKHTHTCFVVSGRELVQDFSIQTEDLLLQDGRIRQSTPLLFFIFLLFFSISLFLPLINQQLLAQSLRQVHLGKVSSSLIMKSRGRLAALDSCG